MGSYDRQGLIGLIPMLGAAVVGLVFAFAAMLMPLDLLETLVGASGLGTIVPLASPPLGGTARALLALGGGAALAAVAWSALYLLWGPGGVLAGRTVATAARPSIRRADAHPDAPPRRPLSAADLGAPPPPLAPPAPPIEQPLPANLDMPLAAFDPAALPAVPQTPVPSVAPLAPPVALRTGERIETFDLSPRARDEGQPSIEQLLRRLEQGTRRTAAG